MLKIKKLIGLCTAAAITATVVAAFAQHNNALKVSSADVTYTISFSHSKNMGTAPTYDAYTELGNPISMEYSSATTTDEFINLNGISGIFFSNNTAINGIKSITINTDQTYSLDNTFNVYGAHSLSSLQAKSYTSEGIATFNSSSTYTFEFDNNSPSFFALERNAELASEDLKINSIDIEYTCVAKDPTYYRVDILGDHITECGTIDVSYKVGTTSITKSFVREGFVAVPNLTSVKFTFNSNENVTFAFWQVKTGTTTSQNSNTLFSYTIKGDSSVYLNAYPNETEQMYTGYAMWQGATGTGKVYYSPNKTLRRVSLLKPLLVLPGDSIIFDSKSSKYKFGYFLKKTNIYDFDTYYYDSGWKAAGTYIVPSSSTVSGTTYNFSYAYLVLNISYNKEADIVFEDYEEMFSCVTINRNSPEINYQIKNVSFTGYNPANLSKEVLYGTNYVATFEEHIDASEIAVTQGMAALVLGTDYTFENHILTVNSVTDDISIAISNNISINYVRFEHLDGCILNSDSSSAVVGNIPDSYADIYVGETKLVEGSDYTLNDNNVLTVSNPTGDITIYHTTLDFTRGYYYSSNGGISIRTTTTKRATCLIPIALRNDEVINVTGVGRQYQFDLSLAKKSPLCDSSYIQVSTYNLTDLTKEYSLTREFLKGRAGKIEDFYIFINFLKKDNGANIDLVDADIPDAQTYISITRA